MSLLWGPIVGRGLLSPDQRDLSSLKEFQRLHLLRNPAASAPEELSAPIDAYIGAGAWRIRCRCGEATHADPDWRTACCFGCGAIYTAVVFPDDWRAIEELLCKRPVQVQRNWLMPETLDSLREEQIGHGDPV